MPTDAVFSKNQKAPPPVLRTFSLLRRNLIKSKKKLRQQPIYCGFLNSAGFFATQKQPTAIPWSSLRSDTYNRH